MTTSYHAAVSRTDRRTAGAGAGAVHAVTEPMLRFFFVIGEFVTILFRGLTPGRWRRTMRTEWMNFLFQVGVRAIPAVAVTAALVGIGLVLQIAYWSSVAGQAERIGEFLVLVLVRQVAPIVTALVLIGRSGSVLVDEIGQLSTDGYISTLRSQGVDPVDFVTLPRCWAMSLAALLLTILFTHVALWIGFAGAAAGDLVKESPLELVVGVFANMQPADHLLFIVKPLLIGYVLAYIPIRIGLGLKPERGSVRRALPRAFVASLLATFAIGVLVSAVF